MGRPKGIPDAVILLIVIALVGALYFGQKATPGGLELRVLSGLTSMHVQGASIDGVLTSGCDREMQVVCLINNFTEQQAGWLAPVLPNGAEGAGRFDFTVGYGGNVHSLSALIRPASETCVTLRVPSGNVAAPFCCFASSCPS